MRTNPFAFLLSLVAMLLASCVSRPMVVDKADGSTAVFMGGLVAAKAGPFIAEVTTRNGTHIKVASESEDATDVPLALAAASVTKNAANATANVANHAASTKSATSLGLGAQGVEKVRIKSAEKVTLGTFEPAKP